MNKLKAFSNALDVLRVLDQTMSISVVQTFVYVCLHEPCTMTAVSKALDVSLSTASRAVGYLSTSSRNKKSALKLVRIEGDPENWRSKLVTLTKTGQTLKDQLIKTLE